MSYEMLASQHLFAHDAFRPIQAKFVAAVGATIKQGKQLIVHAPTGIGKTASVLSPAVAFALEHKKVVFFLTSRHTQHAIALETLQQLQQKHDKKFGVINLVGKQHMCLQQGVEHLHSSEFHSYCKQQREQRMCSFYTACRKKSGQLEVQGSACTEQLANTIIPLTLLKERSSDFGVCPYEIAVELAKEACVIVADYNYMFNEVVRNSFLRRNDIALQDCIVLADEAHNLPSRLKESASARLTSRMLRNAVREADKANEDEALLYVTELANLFDAFIDDAFTERLVSKSFFDDIVEQIGDREHIIETLQGAGERVRDEKKSSYLLGLVEFLVRWQGDDAGFTRILSKHSTASGAIIHLVYRCLDPSLVIREVLQQVHSTVFMSGTLEPIAMYRDLLGAREATLLSFENQFPAENKLSLIVPKTTTKFAKRSVEQFTAIAQEVVGIVESIPGNVIVFFPSYDLLRTITGMISCSRTVLCEEQGMSSETRQEFLDNFKAFSHGQGAVLFAVSNGSFGEGVDLPGNLLNGVVVVGVPLARPDLETKELIRYYDEQFGKGWDYGYLLPAFTTIIQNAGRCIRSASDRGVVVYLDERFGGQFRRFFPDNPVADGMHYKERIRDFFQG